MMIPVLVAVLVARLPFGQPGRPSLPDGHLDALRAQVLAGAVHDGDLRTAFDCFKPPGRLRSLWARPPTPRVDFIADLLRGDGGDADAYRFAAVLLCLIPPPKLDASSSYDLLLALFAKTLATGDDDAFFAPLYARCLERLPDRLVWPPGSTECLGLFLSAAVVPTLSWSRPPDADRVTVVERLIRHMLPDDVDAVKRRALIAAADDDAERFALLVLLLDGDAAESQPGHCLMQYHQLSGRHSAGYVMQALVALLARRRRLRQLVECVCWMDRHESYYEPYGLSDAERTAMRRLIRCQMLGSNRVSVVVNDVFAHLDPVGRRDLLHDLMLAPVQRHRCDVFAPRPLFVVVCFFWPTPPFRSRRASTTATATTTTGRAPITESYWRRFVGEICHRLLGNPSLEAFFRGLDPPLSRQVSAAIAIGSGASPGAADPAAPGIPPDAEHVRPVLLDLLRTLDQLVRSGRCHPRGALVLVDLVGRGDPDLCELCDQAAARLAVSGNRRP